MFNWSAALNVVYNNSRLLGDNMLFVLVVWLQILLNLFAGVLVTVYSFNEHLYFYFRIDLL